MEAVNLKAGCSIAFVGCAVAVITVGVGVWGMVGASVDEHWGECWAYIGLASIGGTVGFIVCAVGVMEALAFFRERLQNSSPDGMKRCQHCGSHLMGNPKDMQVLRSGFGGGNGVEVVNDRSGNDERVVGGLGCAL